MVNSREDSNVCLVYNSSGGLKRGQVMFVLYTTVVVDSREDSNVCLVYNSSGGLKRGQ